tara:strand:+ start:611 stop:904 length:294 start_codon:yes stop_codon:yes gene_type:complete
MNWHLAVAEIANEKQASFRHNKEEGFTEWSNGLPPTEKEIQAKLKELQADYDAKKYQRDRLSEYPDLQECIHAILDDDLTALQAKRKLIKEKYPKPE